MSIFSVLVGAKCYGVYPEEAAAVEKAQHWATRFPQVLVTVRKEDTVWTNGTTALNLAMLAPETGDPEDAHPN